MYQVVVLNRAIIDADTIADELNDHHVDEIVGQLRKQAEDKMKNWRGKGLSIYYYQPRLMIEGDPYWIATLMHSTKHFLNFTETTRLIQRAVETWISRGSAERFLYTSRITRVLSD
ncbi:hypothetical protein Q095_00349 [Pseudomonas aeruginosa PS50]|uniref:hypothetical protein n=1 Tax=Pseudomonas aeruginosa TaxID=287 RepID=UPI00044E9282|nr:hypothetical protein [Pseudomonas aeruginosa]ETU79896.1 hypothetical protein Q095_00349 [Pseudomonas aeruginosa PS50]